MIDRRTFIGAGIAAGASLCFAGKASANTSNTSDTSGELRRLHLAFEVDGEELAERRRLCRRMPTVEVIEWNLAEEGLHLGALRPGDHLWMLVEDYHLGCRTAAVLRRSLPDVVISVYDAAPL